LTRRSSCVSSVMKAPLWHFGYCVLRKILLVCLKPESAKTSSCWVIRAPSLSLANNLSTDNRRQVVIGRETRAKDGARIQNPAAVVLPESGKDCPHSTLTVTFGISHRRIKHTERCTGFLFEGFEHCYPQRPR
jgi:hypothetical protein